MSAKSFHRDMRDYFAKKYSKDKSKFLKEEAQTEEKETPIQEK